MLTSEVENVMTDEEISKISYRDSLDGLLDMLEIQFEGKNITVDLNGEVSGLWFLEDSWFDIALRKDGTRFLTLNADDQSETSIGIEENNFILWDKDETTEIVTIQLDNMTIQLYE